MGGENNLIKNFPGFGKWFIFGDLNLKIIYFKYKKIVIYKYVTVIQLRVQWPRAVDISCIRRPAFLTLARRCRRLHVMVFASIDFFHLIECAVSIIHGLLSFQPPVLSVQDSHFKNKLKAFAPRAARKQSSNLDMPSEGIRNEYP